jgi:hypothetical protein
MEAQYLVYIGGRQREVQKKIQIEIFSHAASRNCLRLAKSGCWLTCFASPGVLLGHAEEPEPFFEGLLDGRGAWICGIGTGLRPGDIDHAESGR